MKTNTHRINNRGAALLIALMMVGVLSVGAAALWQHLHYNLESGKRSEFSDAAQYLAEAGLEQAIAQLRTMPAEYRGEQSTPLGGGNFSVTVLPQNTPGAYRIESTGIFGAAPGCAKRSLAAYLELSPDGAIQVYRCWAKKTR